MKISFSTLVFFLLLQWVPLGAASMPEDNSCEIPAPAGLAVTKVGPTWATVKWNPVNAPSYRVRVYQMPANILVKNQVTSATNLTVTGLSGGFTYKFVVNGICPSGQDSRLNTHLERELIVIDLILKYGSVNTQASISETNGCVSPAWPSSPNAGFALKVVGPGEQWGYCFVSVATGNIIYFNTFEFNPLFPNFIVTSEATDTGVELFVQGVPVGAVSLTWVFNGSPQLEICEFMEPGFNIYYFQGSLNEFQGGGEERNTSAASSNIGLDIFPNPAAGILTFNAYLPENTPGELLIFNAYGSLHRRVSLEKGDNSGQIGLEGLSAGVYFVKVQSGGQTTTGRFLKR